MRSTYVASASVVLLITGVVGIQGSVGSGRQAAAAQTPPAAAAASSGAKTWIDHRQEIEEYLKTAKIAKVEDVKVGVTHPHRAQLEPGGPVQEIAWKPLQPGRYGGYWESYKSEVAAYEIDKLIELNMVPPTVERKYQGDTGAAIMWIENTKSFHDVGGVPGTPGSKLMPAGIKLVNWNRQLMKAKMFDNYIGNIDPNLGNWLFDSEWNLILIDHSRALTDTKKLYHTMQQIDGPLWDRMKALTEEQLTSAVGSLLGKGEIKAIIARRDAMQSEIDKLVKAKGEAAVFVR